MGILGADLGLCNNRHGLRLTSFLHYIFKCNLTTYSKVAEHSVFFVEDKSMAELMEIKIATRILTEIDNFISLIPIR